LGRSFDSDEVRSVSASVRWGRIAVRWPPSIPTSFFTARLALEIGIREVIGILSDLATSPCWPHLFGKRYR